MQPSVVVICLRYVETASCEINIKRCIAAILYARKVSRKSRFLRFLSLELRHECLFRFSRFRCLKVKCLGENNSNE